MLGSNSGIPGWVNHHDWLISWAARLDRVEFSPFCEGISGEYPSVAARFGLQIGSGLEFLQFFGTVGIAIEKYMRD